MSGPGPVARTSRRSGGPKERGACAVAICRAGVRLGEAMPASPKTPNSTRFVLDHHGPARHAERVTGGVRAQHRPVGARVDHLQLGTSGPSGVLAAEGEMGRAQRYRTALAGKVACARRAEPAAEWGTAARRRDRAGCHSRNRPVDATRAGRPAATLLNSWPESRIARFESTSRAGDSSIASGRRPAARPSSPSRGPKQRTNGTIRGAKRASVVPAARPQSDPSTGRRSDSRDVRRPQGGPRVFLVVLTGKNERGGNARRRVRSKVKTS